MLATEPAAPQVGADLARARARLGLSLEEVGAALRIRPAYLAALEQGHVEEVPGGSAYALAFLRSYAEALGLDREAVIRRFKAEAAVLSRTTELTFPAPAPERRIPAGAAALLSAVLAIGVYAGWYRLSAEGRLPPETAAEVPEHLVRLAAPLPVAAPALPAPDAAAPAPASAPPPSNPLAAEAPMIAVSPGSAAAAMPVVASPVTAARAPASAGAAALSAPTDGAEAPTSADEAAPPRLLVRATADAWLQVRDRTGAVLLSRVLHAGETWPVPARPGLVLTTGNAGGTVLVVDGVATAPLGASGAVRRNLSLDPDEVKAGHLAAPAAPR